MNSIESKTHKAYFFTSDRQDGFETSGENGGLGTRSLKKLDKIVLYTINELKMAEIEGRKPIPLKTVHFGYETITTNELCKGIPNNATGGGKLTLKKVWFTYGNSQKGQLSPYQFEYNQSCNYNYNEKGYDRWGNYMPKNYHGFQNSERPYVVQDDPDVDDWAAAWSISKVILPSGGTIEIEYEADDYAYVQDRKAMQMINISGFSPTNNVNDKTNNLFEHKVLSSDVIHPYVFFNLPNTASTDIKDYCPDDMKYIYINCKVDLTRNDKYEYVGSYYEIDHSEKAINGNVGYIKLKHADLNDNMESGLDCHPISKRAWQFARINRSSLVYPGSNVMDADKPVLEIAKAMLGSVNEAYKMVAGFNRALRDKRYGQKVDLTHSWLRLNNNTGFKKGGGHRVKKIYLKDQMEGTKIYGQEYNYTMLDENSGKIISSGVAAYEPLLGGDENPFKEMINDYTINKKLAPNDYIFDEGPIGESFYPGASVGYRRVTVKTLIDSQAKKHATGRTVYEFFTAYDYPVFVDQTPIQSDFSPKFQLSSLIGFTREFSTASQGYVIELNDMHGKPKAQWVYQEKIDNQPSKEETPLSGVEFTYRNNADNPKRLTSEARIMSKNGDLVTADLGKEIDLTIDARQSEIFNGNAGAELNLDMANVGIAFLPVFTFFPNAKLNYDRTRTLSTCKVIQRYGLLHKTIAHKSGANLTTENVAYDPETGDVLLTKTENEYGNHNYSTNIPAHWVKQNDGMGPAYKNINTRIKINLGTTGQIGASNLNNADLAPGDQLIMEGGDKTIWLLSLDNSGNAHFIDKNGNNATSSGDEIYKVMRSGRRNLLGVTAASYTHQDDQLINSNKYIPTNNDNWNRVVNASSVEYRDEWQTVYPTYISCYKKYKFDLWVKYYHEMIAEMIKKGVLTNLTNTGCGGGADLTLTLFENGKFYYGYNQYLLNIHQSSVTQQVNKVVVGLNLVLTNRAYLRQSSTDYVAIEGFYGAINLYNNPSGPVLSGSLHRTFNVKYSYHDHFDFMFYSPLNYNTSNCSFCGVSIGYLGSDKSQYDLINPACSTAQSPLSIAALDLQGSGGVYCSPSPSLYDGSWYVPYNLSYNAYNVFKDLLKAPDQFYIRELHKAGSSILKVHDNTNYTLPLYETSKSTSQLTDYSNLNHSYKTYFNKGLDSLVIEIEDHGGCTNCSSSNTTINPYVKGVKGNWNAKTSYIYFDKTNSDRSSTVTTAPTNLNKTRLKDDGFLPDGFKLFYMPHGSGAYWEADASAATKWTWQEKVTQVDIQGNIIESMNPLVPNIYSSALFSHAHNNLPIAVANNAMRKEIAFNGFEDDNDLAYQDAWNCSADRHLDFAKLYTTDIEVTNTAAHTGKYSLKVKNGVSGNTTSLLNVTKDRETLPTRTFGTPFTIENYNKTQEFSLNTGEKYVLSYWVKADNLNTKIIIKKNGCDLGAGASLVTLTDLQPVSKSIEGWVKVEQSFIITGTAPDMCLEVVNTGSIPGYLDDIRIYPMDGNMKSFVYEPYTLRLWAELDENNYATFYEYDQEGKLVRVKKETERGIKTLQENRNGIKKQ